MRACRPGAHRYDDAMEQSGVYVERYGPKTTPAFVLVHGAPDRSTSFRGVLPYLSDRLLSSMTDAGTADRSISQ